MTFDPIKWVEANPIVAGGVAFVGGLGALYLLGFFSSGASSSAVDDTSAYYAAQAATAQAGDALQAVQIQSNAETAQDLIGASADVTNNTTWATTDLAQTNSNNQSAVSLAPFAEEENLISTLGQVASLPGTTVTSTSQNSGFLGIGASNKTSTSVVPNPSAISAAQLLQDLTTNGLNAAS